MHMVDAELRMLSAAFIITKILDAAFRLLREYQCTVSSKQRLQTHTLVECIDIDSLIDMASEHFHDVVLPQLIEKKLTLLAIRDAK